MHRISSWSPFLTPFPDPALAACSLSHQQTFCLQQVQRVFDGLAVDFQLLGELLQTGNGFGPPAPVKLAAQVLGYLFGDGKEGRMAFKSNYPYIWEGIKKRKI